MKKWYQMGAAVLILLLLAAGCSKKEGQVTPGSGTEETNGTEKTAETEKLEETEKTEETESETGAGGVLEPQTAFPCDLIYASGAGAWGTYLTLNGDGSFTGGYNDSDMGDSGEGYPHGKHYYCEFQGKFGSFEEVDENTFSMLLEELTFQPEEGFEEIRDEILYIGAKPLGLDSGTEFVLYLPGKALTDLPEEFLSWWPGRYEWDGESEGQLGCYGILNKETGAGFFSDAVCTACGAAAVSPQTGECGKCGAAQ